MSLFQRYSSGADNAGLKESGDHHAASVADPPANGAGSEQIVVVDCLPMSPRSARHTILSEVAPFGEKDDELRVVIETPKGSRNKFDYDPDVIALQLGTVLPEGMVFPYDFGFVPSTLGEDRDRLDVLILMDAPVVPGCIVRAKHLGAIEAMQKDKGEKWTRNDRLLAVATHAQTHQDLKSLKDLRPHLSRG